MKVTCDFCKATGHGTMDKLVDDGWQKGVIDVTIGNKRTKKTVIACQEHRRLCLKCPKISLLFKQNSDFLNGRHLFNKAVHTDELIIKKKVSNK